MQKNFLLLFLFRLREGMELRELEDRQRVVRMSMDLHNKEEEESGRALQQQWRMEDSELRLRRETLKQQKLQELYRQEESNEKKLIEIKVME